MLIHTSATTHCSKLALLHIITLTHYCFIYNILVSNNARKSLTGSSTHSFSQTDGVCDALFSLLSTQSQKNQQ